LRRNIGIPGSRRHPATGLGKVADLRPAH